jgi:hypothetical protein
MKIGKINPLKHYILSNNEGIYALNKVRGNRAYV